MNYIIYIELPSGALQELYFYSDKIYTFLELSEKYPDFRIIMILGSENTEFYFHNKLPQGFIDTILYRLETDHGVKFIKI